MFSEGIKSREFWLVAVGTILMSVWPDFPKENFIALATWVIGRAGQKAFGFIDASGKNKWLSSEFLLSIGVTLLTAIFPDMPKEALVGVVGWTALRSTTKTVEAIKE